MDQYDVNGRRFAEYYDELGHTPMYYDMVAIANPRPFRDFAIQSRFDLTHPRDFFGYSPSGPNHYIDMGYEEGHPFMRMCFCAMMEPEFFQTQYDNIDFDVDSWVDVLPGHHSEIMALVEKCLNQFNDWFYPEDKKTQTSESSYENSDLEK
jgi:hypothetical protein